MESKASYHNLSAQHQHKQGNAALVAIIIMVVILCCCISVCCLLYGFMSWSANGLGVNQQNATEEERMGISNDDLTPPLLEDSEQPIDDEVRLPGNFPSDVPIYPNAALSYAGIQEGVTSTIFGVEASPDEVIAYYEAELPANGWEIKETVNFIVTGITAEKGNHELTVGVYGDESATTLTLTIN